MRRLLILLMVVTALGLPVSPAVAGVDPCTLPIKPHWCE